jgi:hypothetical protein
LPEIASNPLVRRAPARRSETSAASTRLAIGKAERINQNVAFSAFHSLEGVEATDSA